MTPYLKKLDSNLQKMLSNISIKRKVLRGAHYESVSKGSSGDTEQNIWSNFDPKPRHGVQKNYDEKYFSLLIFVFYTVRTY